METVLNNALPLDVSLTPSPQVKMMRQASELDSNGDHFINYLYLLNKRKKELVDVQQVMQVSLLDEPDTVR